jgi:hypothetical protein
MCGGETWCLVFSLCVEWRAVARMRLPSGAVTLVRCMSDERRLRLRLGVSDLCIREQLHASRLSLD